MAIQSTGDTAWCTPTASPLSYIPDSSRWDEPHIMSTIARAQNELRLQFLSYTSYSRNGDYYPAIDSSIRAAARRGVHVKLMVADWGKGRRSEKYLKELSALPNIEVRYACVPEWSGGYISYARVEHCKIITADDQTFWLGTSNAEKNYFHGSRNLGIVISNKKLTRQLNEKFDLSWESPASERITVQSSFLPREYGER
jgi:phosphatidylserine/phosphatidylglycerophosphate/cardiolipin synthase-like enzyme